MFEIFGIPSQALFGQLLLGLINGSFYALLSLGLAVIFGMLNIINFTHGAQYMMGAFAAYLLLQYARHQLLGGAGDRADPDRHDRHRHRAACSSSICASSIRCTGCCSPSGWRSSSKACSAITTARRACLTTVPDALRAAAISASCSCPIIAAG